MFRASQQPIRARPGWPGIGQKLESIIVSSMKITQGLSSPTACRVGAVVEGIHGRLAPDAAAVGATVAPKGCAAARVQATLPAG